MADTIRVASEQTNLEVNAGEAVDTVITVQNLGAAVGVFTIDIEGLDPTWYSLSGNSVSLFPGDSTTTTLVVVPPRMSTSLATDYPFTINVSSQRDPEEAETLSLTLKVNAFYDFQLDYQPQRARGVSVEHTLTLSNTGNAVLAFDLEGRDTDGLCTFEFQPETPSVPPGQTAQVTVTAKGKRPFRGLPALFQYDVTATPSNGEAEAKSTFAQLEVPPRIPSWTIRAAMLTVIAVVIGVGVYFALYTFLWAPVEVAELKVSTEFLKLTDGNSRQLYAVSYDGDGKALPEQPVTWVSNNLKVVSVSPDGGLVQANSPGRARITPTLQNQKLDSSKVRDLSVTVLQLVLSTDCISYDPKTIHFGVSAETRLVITDDGGVEVLTFSQEDDFEDQLDALKLASKNWKRCFIGRDNTKEREVAEIEFWISREDDGKDAGELSDSDCEDPYNDGKVKIFEPATGGYILIDEGDMRIVLDNKDDANAAVQLASTQKKRCFLGRTIVNGVQQGYLTQYWK